MHTYIYIYSALAHVLISITGVAKAISKLLGRDEILRKGRPARFLCWDPMYRYRLLHMILMGILWYAYIVHSSCGIYWCFFLASQPACQWNYVKFPCAFLLAKKTCEVGAEEGWGLFRLQGQGVTSFGSRPRVLSHGFAGFANELLELDGPLSGGVRVHIKKGLARVFKDISQIDRWERPADN